MDKHYGWQEGRGSQVPPGRAQNGQRWNERYRDDDRDMRSSRGGEQGGGWEQDDQRWTPSGGNLDREDYVNEGEQYGSQRGRYNRGGEFGGNRGDSGRGQSFSGGHYGGFANEGARNQGSWGQRGQNYGETFGRGYARGDFGGQGSSGQSYGDQSYGSPSYGSPSYGNQGYGNQGSFGQGSRGESGQGYAGRGFSGRGPKGYQRSDERIKEQLSDRLMDDDNIDASEISIEVKNGEATLTGTVSSREEKRAAEELAERSPGVREVQNLLRVTRDTSSAQFGQSGQKSGMSASSSRQDSASGQSKSRNERE